MVVVKRRLVLPAPAHAAFRHGAAAVGSHLTFHTCRRGINLGHFHRRHHGRLCRGGELHLAAVGSALLVGGVCTGVVCRVQG